MNAMNDFLKILVFHKTDTNQELLRLQSINYEEKNDKIILRLDPNEWINFQMILKLKQFQDNNSQKIQDLALFSRPLIKDLLLELLQNLLDLKNIGYQLLEINLDAIWIQFDISNNFFHFKKLIILNQIIRFQDYKDADSKILQLIQPILNIYKEDDYDIFHLGIQDKIQHIKRQRPYSYYKQKFKVHYQYTILNNFKQCYKPKDGWLNINDEILQNTLLYEIYQYQLPLDEGLIVQIQSKYQLIKDEINRFLRQFQCIISEFDEDLIILVREQFFKIISQKIQHRGYANYVSYYINFKLQINTFIEKQEIFYILFELIHQLDDEVKQFGLLLILNEILTKQKDQKYCRERDQIELQEKHRNNLKEIREIIYGQLELFYFQIQNHLQLNENLKKHIFFGLDLPLILNSLCKQLKTSYAEWYQDKSKLIKQALQTQQIFIREQFFKSITLYVENL